MRNTCLKSALLTLLSLLAASDLRAAPVPLSLDQVVEESLAKNLRLLAERFNLSIGEARIIQARLRPNPVLSVGGNYLDALGSGFYSGGTAAGPTEVNARIDYMIERGKKRNERIAVAEAAKAVSQLELLNSTRTLILDVQGAFVEPKSLVAKVVAMVEKNYEAFNKK